MNQALISAIFLQYVGTVGSGIFVLPYLFLHSNYIFAIFFLVVLGVVTIVLNRFYAHIVSNTPGDHQLAGYAQLYLGGRFGQLASLNLILLSFGAIAVYVKLFQSFASVAFPVISAGLTPVFYFIFLFLIYWLHFKNCRLLEIAIPIFMFIIPLVIFIISLAYPFAPGVLISSIPNFSFFGATIYALSGFTIIPEVQEVLLKTKTNRHSLSLAVTWGVVLVIISYLLFTYGIIRLSNGSVSIDSVAGLALSFPLLARLISFFGAIVVVRASFGFLIILRELFLRDLHLPPLFSNLIPLSFPLLSYTLGAISLITLISITGHITIFISALLICLIRLKLKHGFWTEFWTILIMLCLVFGLLINTL